MLQSQEHKDFLKNRALEELHSSEIMEWYRYQYNIPLQDFYKMEIDEDTAHIDFYRRQYWNELRYGVREWLDFDIEFKIPPYTIYRGNGGTLPIPNGFGYDGNYSVKFDHYRTNKSESSSKKSNKTNGLEDEDGYTYTENPNAPSKIPGLLYEDETAAYKTSAEEFEEMVRRASEDDDSMWEELERLTR